MSVLNFLAGLDPFLDAINAAVVILSATGMLEKKDDKIKITESGRKAVKDLAPSFFGFGSNDEAIKLSAWSQLHPQVRKQWRRNMQSLGGGWVANDQRARLILVISKIQNLNEQLKSMEALAGLTGSEFKETAENFRLITPDDAIVNRVKQWIEDNGLDFVEDQFEVIKKAVKKGYAYLDAEAARLAPKIDAKVNKTAGGLQKKVNKIKNRGPIGRFFNIDIPF